MEAGKFRPDLYYRLNVFRIELPPLRARKEDIPPLVEHFIHKYASSMNKQVGRVSGEALDLLQQHDWPGNVRELENAVERAMVVARASELLEVDFTLKRAEAGPVCLSLEDAERAHILEIVELCGGNQTRAAELLEIDRVTLHHKLKKYGWKRPLVGSS